MVTVNDFGDEAGCLKLFKYFLLALVIVNDFIKLIILFSVVIWLEDGYLISIRIDLQQISFMSSIFFVFQKRAYSNRHANIWRH